MTDRELDPEQSTTGEDDYDMIFENMLDRLDQIQRKGCINEF